jgi:hypothetical protein
VLALDLRDLIELLSARSLKASWGASPVRLECPARRVTFEEFMVTGPRAPRQDLLEKFAANGSPISGASLREAAREVRQVIWGQFTAMLPHESDFGSSYAPSTAHSTK